MKKKILKLLKNNIFCFIIGGIMLGTVGVGATTYLFQSNQVSYTKEGSNVTDVKGALDELYSLSVSPKYEQFTGYFSLVPVTSDGGCTSLPYSDTCYSSKFKISLKGYSKLSITSSDMYTSYQVFIDGQLVDTFNTGDYRTVTYDIKDKSVLVIYAPANSNQGRAQGTYTLIP